MASETHISINEIESSQQQNNGRRFSVLSKMTLNIVVHNKPLLSILSLVTTMFTFIGIIGGTMVLAYFTIDFISREVNECCAVLLSYSILDFVFPLIYSWKNKDYQTHTAQALKETINFMF